MSKRVSKKISPLRLIFHWFDELFEHTECFCSSIVILQTYIPMSFVFETCCSILVLGSREDKGTSLSGRMTTALQEKQYCKLE